MTPEFNIVSSLPDSILSVFTDISKPLVLEIQLTWFDEIISNFMAEIHTFPTQYGVVIRRSNWFTYVPVEMERERILYLDGFSSNCDGGAYDSIEIKCVSEEEKLVIREQLCNALQQLATAAVERTGLRKRSYRMAVGLDKIT